MPGRLSLKGDLTGGVAVAVLTIPVSMGYGLLALQPLGDGYVSHGVMAGLFSAIVVLFVGALLGGSAGLMLAPRSVVTLVMATVVLEGVVRAPAAIAAPGDTRRALTLVFFIVLAAGLFQTLFGALRLGSLIRYIPAPVMAGFQNAAAILILSFLEGLTEAECTIVRALLVRRAYTRGEVLIQEGSRDRDLFLMSRGIASVKVELPGQDRQRRLASFSAGAVFGEVALLDQEPRSATVTADEDVVCYVLPEEAFRALVRDHHAIAITLLTNLGREMSRRLRRANAMISELER